jgi:predicted ATPase
MSSIYIREVSVENFKCFSGHKFQLKSPDGVTPGSGLNVLIGENGNGKTAFLEAINYTNQSSYAAENRISINDFQDHEKPIQIIALTSNFTCKMPELYRGCTFESDGIMFKAMSRDRKSPGKLLSSPFSVRSSFLPMGNTYKKSDGSDSGKEIPAIATGFSNGSIQGSELNVFYFDKNRTRQISSGTYKTTFERICDDLNWKFLKNIKGSDVLALLENISGEYFSIALTIAQKGTGKKLAEEMANFFGQEQFLNLKIDLVDLLHPFTKAFFAVRPDDELTQVAPKDLGSGVEIVLTLLLLRSIAAESKGGIVYLIDEPELHLHPTAQQKLGELLLEESAHTQVVVSTHSPYLIRGFMSAAVNKIVLTRDATGAVDIEYPDSSPAKLFPWSPSWGEVNFNAYGMATVEFHNELYGWLQEKHSLATEAEVETHLVAQGLTKSKQWTRERGGVVQVPYDITLSSYVRNSIHHPENRHNDLFSDSELVESINDLISVVT